MEANDHVVSATEIATWVPAEPATGGAPRVGGAHESLNP